MGYESERGNPSTDQCSVSRAGAQQKLGLLFDGYYLKLIVGNAVDSAWFARSGRDVGKSFPYDQERQKMRDTGPIPSGDYWILPKQVAQPKFSSDSWGRYRITIHQRPTTEAYGRGGFFIHGGATFGSAGCIDLAKGMDLFINKLAEFFHFEDECVGTFGTDIPQIVCVFKPFDTDGFIPLTVSYATSVASYPPFFG